MKRDHSETHRQRLVSLRERPEGDQRRPIHRERLLRERPVGVSLAGDSEVS